MPLLQGGLLSDHHSFQRQPAFSAQRQAPIPLWLAYQEFKQKSLALVSPGTENKREDYLVQRFGELYSQKSPMFYQIQIDHLFLLQ